MDGFAVYKIDKKRRNEKSPHDAFILYDKYQDEEEAINVKQELEREGFEVIINRYRGETAERSELENNKSTTM